MVDAQELLQGGSSFMDRLLSSRHATGIAAGGGHFYGTGKINPPQTARGFKWEKSYSYAGYLTGYMWCVLACFIAAFCMYNVDLKRAWEATADGAAGLHRSFRPTVRPVEEGTICAT